MVIIWKHSFAKIGEDWVFLAILGIIMAIVSFIMDYGISICNTSRIWLYHHVSDHVAVQYFMWVTLPVFLVLFSAGFVHILAPQAIGSGIPEMKTILRGVVLKEYLSFKTFIAKAIGLTATLGSGMPLGKEGPFVHIASIMATLLSKLVTSFQGIYANESRNSEMLAAACAVGVACCFGAPVGGVLFSIEVTAVYFAVRNYWRGFFAAVIGALVFRLLAIWFNQEETIVAVFMTAFEMSFPFDPQELFVFAVIGVFCGLGGALYVYLHRRYVLWMRGNKKLSKFLQKNRFIYPFLVSLLTSSVTFPPGLGQYIAGDLTTHDQVESLFSNHTWTKDPEELTVDEWEHIRHWCTESTSIFFNLVCYILFNFAFSILCSTLPVPFGVLIPTFKVGAAFGRLVGEAMHVWFPDGVRYGENIAYIMPGGYATVGAAAFSGAVTHTISISVIVFEMTGQITHCIPILIAVLAANAVASLLSPSCYDSIIMIKKLPYLPDILPSSSTAYNIFVEDFMVRDIKYIWYGMSYKELKSILRMSRKLRSFPLVDNPDQMVLLGSIQRTELISTIQKQIGRDRRLDVVAARKREAVKRQQEEAFLRLKEEERRQEEERKKMLEEEKKKREEEEEAERLRKAAEEAKAAQSAAAPKAKQRRPSRFEVTNEAGATFVPDADTIESDNESSNDNLNGSRALSEESPAAAGPKGLQQLSTMPKKSILKKSNSYTIHAGGPGIPGFNPDINQLRQEAAKRRLREQLAGPKSVYTTVTGTEKIRTAIGNIQNLFKRPSQLTLSGLRDGDAGSDDGFDMSVSDRREWERSEMEKDVDFSDCHVDPAPFQLVEKTSLLKVHSMFSMLGVNHAYVTAIGRLIGVVALKELRKSIEEANAGQTGRSQSSPAAPAPEPAPLKEPLLPQRSQQSSRSVHVKMESADELDFGDSDSESINLHN